MIASAIEATSVQDLLRMPATEIDALYRASSTPSVHELDGGYDGYLLRAQLPVAAAADFPLAAVNHPLLPWKGKVFFAPSGARGRGGNRWALGGSERTIWPFETTTVPSRFGGAPAVLIDYDIAGNPLWLRKLVFDELKKLRDDLFLGIGGLRVGPALPFVFRWAITRAR